MIKVYIFQSQLLNIFERGPPSQISFPPDYQINAAYLIRYDASCTIDCFAPSIIYACTYHALAILDCAVLHSNLFQPFSHTIR